MSAFTELENVGQLGLTGSSTGELLYALGNVATKQAGFLGKVYSDKSLVYFKNALQSFQAAAPDKYSAAGLAKTHYKIAVHFIRSPDLDGALYGVTVTDSKPS